MMKRHLWLLLLPALAFAGDRYLLVITVDSATPTTKTEVSDEQAKIAAEGGLPSSPVSTNSLPPVCMIASTTTTGRVLCLDVTKPNSPWKPLKTDAKGYNDWVQANITTTDKAKTFAVGSNGDHEAALKTVGWMYVVPKEDEPKVVEK